METADRKHKIITLFALHFEVHSKIGPFNNNWRNVRQAHLPCFCCFFCNERWAGFGCQKKKNKK